MSSAPSPITLSSFEGEKKKKKSGKKTERLGKKERKAAAAEKKRVKEQEHRAAKRSHQQMEDTEMDHVPAKKRAVEKSGEVPDSWEDGPDTDDAVMANASGKSDVEAGSGDNSDKGSGEEEEAPAEPEMSEPVGKGKEKARKPKAVKPSKKVDETEASEEADEILEGVERLDITMVVPELLKPVQRSAEIWSERARFDVSGREDFNRYFLAQIYKGEKLIALWNKGGFSAPKVTASDLGEALCGFVRLKQSLPLVGSVYITKVGAILAIRDKHWSANAATEMLKWERERKRGQPLRVTTGQVGRERGVQLMMITCGILPVPKNGSIFKIVSVPHGLDPAKVTQKVQRTLDKKCGAGIWAVGVMYPVLVPNLVGVIDVGKYWFEIDHVNDPTLRPDNKAFAKLTIKGSIVSISEYAFCYSCMTTFHKPAICDHRDVREAEDVGE